MHRVQPHEGDNVALGLALTALQVLSYFSFVAACCFAPDFIAGRRFSSGIPVSFSLGLGVIVLGVVLTIVYVAVTNREGAR